MRKTLKKSTHIKIVSLFFDIISSESNTLFPSLFQCLYAFIITYWMTLVNLLLLTLFWLIAFCRWQHVCNSSFCCCRWCVAAAVSCALWAIVWWRYHRILISYLSHPLIKLGFLFRRREGKDIVLEGGLSLVLPVGTFSKTCWIAGFNHFPIVLNHLWSVIIIRLHRCRSAAACSRQTFLWTVCQSVGRSVCLSVCPVHCGKTADRIRMPFGVIGWTGPGIRRVMGFADPSTRRGTFWGRIWSAPL